MIPFKFELYSGTEITINCDETKTPVIEPDDLKKILMTILIDCRNIIIYDFKTGKLENTENVKFNATSYYNDYIIFMRNYLTGDSVKDFQPTAKNLADLITKYYNDYDYNKLFLDLYYNYRYITSVDIDSNASSDQITSELKSLLNNFYDVYTSIRSGLANPENFVKSYYDFITTITDWLSTEEQGYAFDTAFDVATIAPSVLSEFYPSTKSPIKRPIYATDRQDSFSKFKEFYYPQGYIEERFQVYASNDYWYNMCFACIKAIHFQYQFNYIFLNTENPWTPMQALRSAVAEYNELIDSDLICILKLENQSDLADKMARESLEASTQYLKKCENIFKGDYSDTVSEPSKLHKEKTKQAESIKQKKSKEKKTKIKEKKTKTPDLSGGDKDMIQAMIKEQGLETTIKNLQDTVDGYSNQDLDPYLDAQAIQEKEIAEKRLAYANSLVKKSKEKNFKKDSKRLEQVKKNINMALPNSSAKARERLQNLVTTIDSIPNPQQLQSFINQYLGNSTTTEDKITLGFNFLESIGNEKVAPVIEQLKPWYDLLMVLYNFKFNLSLDTVVEVVTQLVMIQFAPFFQKYNQIKTVIDEVSAISGEVNILASAVSRKASEFGMDIDINIPNIPTLPSFGNIPFSFDGGESGSSIKPSSPTKVEYLKGDGENVYILISPNTSFNFPDIATNDIKFIKNGKDLLASFSNEESDILALKNFYKKTDSTETDFGDVLINDKKISSLIEKNTVETE